MSDQERGGGKGRPTPKRKDAQSSQRKGFVVPRDNKQARKAGRERDREARAVSRAGLMAGDPRFFPIRDRGPVREHIRDFIDSKRTVGEYFVPSAFLVLILGLIPEQNVQRIVVYGWTAMLGLVLVDTFLVGIRLRINLRKSFPDKSHRRGATAYGVLRALQMRRFRIPPPRVAPGGGPVKPRKSKTV